MYLANMAAIVKNEADEQIKDARKKKITNTNIRLMSTPKSVHFEKDLLMPFLPLTQI